MSPKLSPKVEPTPTATTLAVAVLTEVRDLILEARQQTARMVNAGLTLLYWRVGDRVRREILKEKRAEYGAEIVSAVGRLLEQEFGQGFAEKNLRRMVQFAEVFPDREIVVSLIRQLTWTHFIALIPLKDQTVEVLELEPRGIHVAEYLTELPPRELMEQRLREAVVRARLQLEQVAVSAE